MEVVSRDSLRGLEGQICMMTGGYSRGFTQRPKGLDMYDDWMVFQGIHLGPKEPYHSRISWVPITTKENVLSNTLWVGTTQPNNLCQLFIISSVPKVQGGRYMEKDFRCLELGP